MTSKVLCPIDGTPHSMRALSLAAEIAAKFSAELWLCVVNVVQGGGRGPLVLCWTDTEAQKMLDDAAAQVKAQGGTVTHSGVVVHREAASGIVAHADDKGIDHIVMGTGDKHGFSRLMLGSVAADVCARAHCTVTVAR